MELTVRTLQGSITLTAGENTTVEEFKKLIHGAQQSSSPERQNLVFEGRLLNGGLLKDAGIKPGASLVLLTTTPMPKQQAVPSVPAPTIGDIYAAVSADARQRGVTLREDVPAGHTGGSLGMPTRNLSDMDNQLMGMIEALEGRLGMLRQGDLAGGLAGGLGEPRAGAAAAAAATAGAVQEPAVPQEPIVAPEPDQGNVQQLGDMGFSAAVAGKALILHRNRLPEAVEWLLQHAEDEDAAAPVTQEQLRRVYGPQPPRSGLAAGAGNPSANMANAIRNLQMTLMQAVAAGGDGMGGADGGAGGQPDASDALSVFRRRLEAQLGSEVGGGGAAGGDGGASLADLFPLEALMGFGADQGGIEDEDMEEEDGLDHDHHMLDHDGAGDDDEGHYDEDEDGAAAEEEGGHDEEGAMRL